MARIAYDHTDALAFAATRHLGDASSWRAAIVEHFDPKPGSRLLDLGAGTGSWSRNFAGWFPGVEVVAVEPSAAMRELSVFQQPILAGHAAAIPLADSSVDAVWISTVIHHVPDLIAAAAELRRVLRPGGVVGFVWNTRDERVPWVRALGELLAAEARDHEADQGVVDTFAAALPADVEVLDSAVVQTLTPEQVVAGIGTRSYVATMDAHRRAAFLGRVHDLLAGHPDTTGRFVLELPYTTRAYRLTPRG